MIDAVKLGAFPPSLLCTGNVRILEKMPSLDEIIDTFGEQVKSLIGQVGDVPNPAFRKALYVSMLDGLSACAYGESLPPGRRFKTFLAQIGGWTDGERISLPQAALLFKGDVLLSTAIAKRLADWKWGTLQQISSDPLPTELQVTHADLWKAQHANLLWKFRNSLLHAFYDPGSFDVRGDSDEIYYVGNVDTHLWELVVPDGFLRSLLTTSLTNLLSHCKTTGLDPQAHLGKALWV